MSWLDIFGYVASLIVLISLLMSSIIKLRFINLIGAILFTIYALLIKSYPTAVMNFGIVCINIYFIVKIYGAKDSFKIMPIEGDSQYFKEFVGFYEDDIEKSSGISDFDLAKYDESFYILRNLIPAGVLIGSKYSSDTLKLDIDYVIPQYRDFKIGSYIFDEKKDYLTKKGYKNIISCSTNSDHIKYLNRMGFKETNKFGEACYIKEL